MNAIFTMLWGILIYLIALFLTEMSSVTKRMALMIGWIAAIIYIAISYHHNGSPF